MMLVFRHNIGVYSFGRHYLDGWKHIYSKPYTRIPAYFVGIAAAWILDELEQRGINRETRPDTLRARAWASVGAGVAVLVLLLIIFMPYTDFGSHRNSWD